MTDQEALEAFFAEWHKQANEVGESLTQPQRDCAEEAWNAALAWLRSHGEPVAWMYPRAYGSGLAFVKPVTCCDEDGNVVDPVPLFLAPQPAIPDGWQLVPKVPTREMLAEVWYNDERDIESTARLKTAYHAMLAASPQCNQGD